MKLRTLSINIFIFSILIQCPLSNAEDDYDKRYLHAASKGWDYDKQPLPTGVDKSTFDFKDTQNILFCLDTSVSSGKIFLGRQTRLEKSKEMIAAILNCKKRSLNFGLRTFGDEIVPTREYMNTALILPIGSYSKGQFLKSLVPITSSQAGAPLRYCMQEIYEKDLRDMPGKTLVILFSAAEGNYSMGLNYVRAQAKYKNVPAKFMVLDFNGRILKQFEKQTEERLAASLEKSPRSSTCLKYIAELTNGEYFLERDFPYFLNEVYKIENIELKHRNN